MLKYLFSIFDLVTVLFSHITKIFLMFCSQLLSASCNINEWFQPHHLKTIKAKKKAKANCNEDIIIIYIYIRSTYYDALSNLRLDDRSQDTEMLV